MADAATTLRITKLNGTNYQTWTFKLALLLTKEDLWETTIRDPPDSLTDDWRIKDRKARANIGLLLEDSQLHLVRKETTAKGMWTSLQRYHEKSTLSNKVSLLRRICNLKLPEGGNMERHIIQMQDLIDQLASLGEAHTKLVVLPEGIHKFTVLTMMKHSHLQHVLRQYVCYYRKL